MIEIQELSFKYSGAKENALNNISLKIEKGDFVGIIGESGAGKTTLCNCMNALIPHHYRGDYYGSVKVDGTDTFDTNTSTLALKVGSVFQDIESQLVTSFVEEEILFGLENFGVPQNEIENRISSALESLGITELHHRELSSLSGGQKQKVVIAAILAIEPDILILDEPTGELDPASSVQIFSLLKKKFCALPQVQSLLGAEDLIRVAPLTPEAILGSAERKDFPVLSGKEIIQQAEFRHGRGQSFTAYPASAELTLADLLKLDIGGYKKQALFVAGINAVLQYLGLINNAVHCKDDGPERCSLTAAERLSAELGDVKLALIGYQPCLFANLSRGFPHMRATDLSPDKIGRTANNVTVEDAGTATEEVCQWADVILCTGSTLTNGTFPWFYGCLLGGKDVRFYGTTVAGAAYLLDLPRMCYADGNGRP